MQPTKENRIAEIERQLAALESLSQFAYWRGREKLKKELKEELEGLKRDWGG